MSSYPIPDTALGHHTILLGKTRAGKSSTMRGIVERLLDQGRPVGIIDPKGDWWGLKSSADGKKAGFPVIIFGGEHADVPINSHSGAHVAELVATGNRPFIVDLGGWMVGERTRFFLDFASTFFRHTRGPRHLAIDEVHNFAPQGKVMDPDAGKMLHWANRLASEGAGKGITLLSASQRPQKVHKDYLTSHETLIAMRVIHKLDRDAIADWIRGCPDQALGTEVLNTLASMERGEGWVWCPEAKFGPVRIQFPMFSTYDSFAAPTTETVEKLKGWASVDLEDVRTKLATVLEEAKANDPRELKAEIAALKRELAKAPQPQSVSLKDYPTSDLLDEVERRDPRWLKHYTEFTDLEQDRDRWKVKAEHLDGCITAAARALGYRDIEEIGRDLEDKRFHDGLKPARLPTRRVPADPAPVQRRPAPVREVPAARSPAPPPTQGHKFPKAQQAILDSLAWWKAFGFDAPSNEQVAFIAGYSPTSTGYTNPRSALVTAGLVRYPSSGRVSLTDDGKQFSAPVENVPTGEELRRRVLEKLKAKAPVAILSVLMEAYPDELSNEDCASRAGYSAQSTGYTNPRSALRTLGAIDYPSSGMVRANDWLFP